MRSAKMNNRFSLLRWILVGTAIALTTLVAEYLALSPVGSPSLLLPKSLALVFSLGLLTCSATLALLLPLTWLSNNSIRPRIVKITRWTSCALIVALGVALTPMIRRLQFDAFVVRSEPLLAAIASYEKDLGIPPDSLEALVPDYLESVPLTGMGAYPEFKYHPIGAVDSSWALMLFTPSVPMEFDQLWYLPNANYWDVGLGRHTPVGAWAYFDD